MPSRQFAKSDFEGAAVKPDMTALIDWRQHVGHDLVAIGQGIRRVEEGGDRQDLPDSLRIQAEFHQGGRVGLDAV